MLYVFNKEELKDDISIRYYVNHFHGDGNNVVVVIVDHYNNVTMVNTCNKKISWRLDGFINFDKIGILNDPNSLAYNENKSSTLVYMTENRMVSNVNNGPTKIIHNTLFPDYNNYDTLFHVSNSDDHVVVIKNLYLELLIVYLVTNNGYSKPFIIDNVGRGVFGAEGCADISLNELAGVIIPNRPDNYLKEAVHFLKFEDCGTYYAQTDLLPLDNRTLTICDSYDINIYNRDILVELTDKNKKDKSGSTTFKFYNDQWRKINE